VVLLIISLASGVVVLNAPPPASVARTEADRFAARLAAASEQAVMTGTTIGLAVAPEGFSFYTYGRAGWTLIEAAQLRPSAFPAGIGVKIDLPGSINENEKPGAEDENIDAPTLFFTPTGEATPLEMVFRARRRAWVLSLDRAGAIEVARYGGL